MREKGQGQGFPLKNSYYEHFYIWKSEAHLRKKEEDKVSIIEQHKCWRIHYGRSVIQRKPQNYVSSYTRCSSIHSKS